MTELTESSPSAPPQSVLCGSVILSKLASPWLMASSGHFDPSQTYDGYKEVECHFHSVGKTPCHHTGLPDSNIRRHLMSKKDGRFGKEFPGLEAPTPDGTSGYSNCGNELEGEEVEVVHNSAGHQSSTSPSHPPSKRFQSQIIPSTPRTSQPILLTIPISLPPASPSSFTTRPALIPAPRPSPIYQYRNCPIVTSQQLQ
ncbi:hypothetical protein O181_015330 [Austropuccinia psidii MF-1]|uniref:Uncharacterized protein n=1 Tax=Austropuccinia psidii MF-1 TaxID=1389203 RepID=A0A9Q3GQV0_9BASI|nr:hypothetical protein [Austropuccinia psidii MF-1]